MGRSRERVSHEEPLRILVWGRGFYEMTVCALWSWNSSKLLGPYGIQAYLFFSRLHTAKRCAKQRGWPENDPQSAALLENMRAVVCWWSVPTQMRGQGCTWPPVHPVPSTIEVLCPLSLGKLEESCFLWVYVSSFLPYALDKAEYFLIIERRKKSYRTYPWNGKGMVSSYFSLSWQEVT